MINSNHSANWAEAIAAIQCPGCGGTLEAATQTLTCQSCTAAYAIHDGLLVTSESITGNNRIAADFYNSPSWERYRFWKRFTPFNERAVSKWRAEVFQHLPSLENTKLLDVAIGAGLTMPLVPDTCDVFGIDVSEQQLRDCQHNNPERSLKLVLGEAEKLPFVDNAFDNVLSFGAFNYFNDPLLSLQEMARVIKPDGVIVITDEYPDIPTRMIGHRIGWPELDRWILSNLLHLGDDFAALINNHCELKIEPIVEQVFDSWEISECCNRAAYCIVGRVKK